MKITPLLDVAQPTEDDAELSTTNLNTLGLVSGDPEVQQSVSNQVAQFEQTVIGEKLIVTCLTPFKVKLVQGHLEKKMSGICAL